MLALSAKCILRLMNPFAVGFLLRTMQKNIERFVMSWAAEHTEPVYPTWYEYLCDMYQADWNLTIANNHIPADVAQKLGIEPKGES